MVIYSLYLGQSLKNKSNISTVMKRFCAYKLHKHFLETVIKTSISVPVFRIPTPCIRRQGLYTSLY